MKALKTVLFHILYTFRGTIRLVLNAIFSIGFIGSIILIIIKSQSKHFTLGYLPWGLFFIIGSKIALWNYDKLLLKLKPDNINLILFQ